MEDIGSLDPAVQAQVLAQLAVAEEVRQLREAVQALDSTISSRS